MSEDGHASEIFRQRLKNARELRGYSQEELAKRARMPASSIAHFETGRKPSFDSLRRLAVALEITTDYLLGRVESPELAQDGDPLFRDVAKLTGSDREIARDFLEMLANRRVKKD
ncbi:MAG: helix-turn-helix transcriptional regulator [Nisaea sp.]|uniref:helix-turn-helix domain-containing protein n=1 Tax=Nisaea sp. TaxID=2024842 RepID=UPI001B076444|nr:helix-turn-helix transcriptional regulator [Nisaea sp.]MBO6560475.1 helix-turn-helix transcriptional regulator [Nisaea sp.]